MGIPRKAFALANLFMDKGLITYVQGQKVSREDSQAVASKQINKLPLAVAGRSREPQDRRRSPAAALLDSKRAQVVGERTYGDAAIRKAWDHGRRQRGDPFLAEYYSPDGKAIQDTWA